MAAHRALQSLDRSSSQHVQHADFSGRSPNGLRLVVVGRSDDGDDIVAVCDDGDGHPGEIWFTGVLTRAQALVAVCERCREETRLQHRRALILDSYGRETWLRVLGRG